MQHALVTASVEHVLHALDQRRSVRGRRHAQQYATLPFLGVRVSMALDVAKWAIASGRGPQNFLGGAWVARWLARTPAGRRRRRALRVLGRSPHYFFGRQSGDGRLSDEGLESKYARHAASREHLCRQLFAPVLSPDSVVLEYGCGPGFLARAIATRVRTVYACDISQGALACAAVLNPAPALTYLPATPDGLARIADNSLDLVCSFALTQHLNDAIFDEVLRNCSRRLKPGGAIAFQMRCDDPGWRTEQQWRDDRTVRGRLRFRYGLHCFGRSAESIRTRLSHHTFKDISLIRLADLPGEPIEDPDGQCLLTARR
jgi:SAM-dependent methyltransferase